VVPQPLNIQYMYIVGNSIHCNLFVRVLEAGSKASFWRAFLVCIAASAN